MVNDLAHGHAAKDRAKETVLPPVAMGAINEGQAQVTGEVGPFPKQGCLERWRSTENKQGWVSTEWVQQNNTGLSSVELLTQSLPASPSPSKRHKIKQSHDIITVLLQNTFLSDHSITDCACG